MRNVTFPDVLFEPRYSEIESRSGVNLTSDLGKFKLSLPIISANMKDITGPKMCAEMACNGAMGILHRFETEDEDYGLSDFEYAITLYSEKVQDIELESIKSQLYKVWNNKDLDNDSKSKIMSVRINEVLNTKQQHDTGKNPLDKIGVSIGVKEHDKKRFEKLFNRGASIFCIDVAHGHHVLVKNMIQWIRKSSKGVCLIAGNIATHEAASDLIEWGADIIKVGIGPGEVCRTRKNTGVGVPQLSALERIRESNPKSIIISDGGIKTTGDIAKALKYANAVMLGNFLAGSTETPGHVYQTPDDQLYKVYGGSASGERKVQNGRDNSFVEGVVKMVPFKGHVKYILKQIRENLQSSLSYSGANNLSEFREKAVLMEISGGAKSESKL